MKTILYYGFLIIVASLVLARVSTYINGLSAAPEWVQGKLAPCPDKPNCVCSEEGNDKGHLIEAIKLSSTDVTASLTALKQAIEKTGGKISSETDWALTARYTSRLMGYVDDFQVRADADSMEIHLRSASRIGRSDLGVNLKRVNEVKKHYFELV